MGVGKKFSARLMGLRLRIIKCGKTGKYSIRMYWYRRVSGEGIDTEVYLRPADDLSPEPIAICAGCGKKFFQTRHNHIYCMPSCRLRTWRKRQKLIKANMPEL
jgi:hypothetical protein